MLHTPPNHILNGQNRRTALDEALRHCRSAFKTVAVFSLAINILMLATPIYMLQVFDRVLSSGHVETLVLLTIMAVAAIFVLSVLDTLRGSVTIRIGSWLSEQLGPLYLASGVRAQLRGSGDGAQPLRDISQIQNFIATQGLTAFFDSPWVPIYVFVIWLLHPLLGVIALISALLLFALSLANDRATRGPGKAAAVAQIAATNLADITIRNAEVVRAMGFLPAMVERWRKINDTSMAAMRAQGDAGGFILSLTKFVRMSVQIAILGTGAWLVVRHEIGPGAMIAGSILLGRALAPVEMAIGAWKGFVSARLAYGRLKAQIETHPPEAPRTQLPNPVGRVWVDGLTYIAPTSRQPILSQVSFDMRPGQALAIIGPSGAGKSTLCRLIVGLSNPTRGEVRLDGSDVRHWDPEQLGRYVGFLPQDVELFPGTVRENIARMGGADDEAVIEAARLAHVHPLIQRLPQGYDTRIGSNGGIRLSGGQRQRVGLARAVFGDPKLIVLDEPNANLDQAGESALAEALGDLKKKGCALIIVGHRPSTLAQADTILVLQDGCVAMHGPRDEVLKSLSEASARNSSQPTVPLRKTTHQVKAPENASEPDAATSRPDTGSSRGSSPPKRKPVRRIRRSKRG